MQDRAVPTHHAIQCNSVLTAVVTKTVRSDAADIASAGVAVGPMRTKRLRQETTLIERHGMIAKIETILNQFDRGNGRKTKNGSANNDLAREIVQRLQSDGDLTPDAEDARDPDAPRGH